MWPSAAVDHLVQVSMCAFRDAYLNTSVVTGDYINYCCLSICSNQSDHSPLASGINKAFAMKFSVFAMCCVCYSVLTDC